MSDFKLHPKSESRPQKVEIPIHYAFMNDPRSAQAHRTIINSRAP